jgi:hypothetical protein
MDLTQTYHYVQHPQTSIWHVAIQHSDDGVIVGPRRQAPICGHIAFSTDGIADVIINSGQFCAECSHKILNGYREFHSNEDKFITEFQGKGDFTEWLNSLADKHKGYAVLSVIYYCPSGSHRAVLRRMRKI